MMMDERDKDIERLFDGYADELEDRSDLARSARERMRSQRHDSARGKRIALISIASVAGVAAAAAVGVFAVSAALRIADVGNGSAPPAVNETQYDIHDVRAVAVSREQAAEYFDISVIEERYNVFAENYYACYLENDELVYVRGSFGMETEYGTTQVGVIAEKAEYRRSDLKNSFAAVIAESNRPISVYDYINGEYVSQTYMGTESTHYYVTTMGNDENAYTVVTGIFL